jgi:hypothetical protein
MGLPWASRSDLKAKVTLISIGQISDDDGPYSEMAFDLKTPPYYTETYDEN